VGLTVGLYFFGERFQSSLAGRVRLRLAETRRWKRRAILSCASGAGRGCSPQIVGANAMFVAGTGSPRPSTSLRAGYVAGEDAGTTVGLRYG